MHVPGVPLHWKSDWDKPATWSNVRFCIVVFSLCRYILKRRCCFPVTAVVLLTRTTRVGQRSSEAARGSIDRTRRLHVLGTKPLTQSYRNVQRDLSDILPSPLTSSTCSSLSPSEATERPSDLFCDVATLNPTIVALPCVRS